MAVEWIPDEQKRRALIAAMEARMRQVETFAWGVPALVIAGLSFLLTIGLDRTGASLHGIEGGYFGDEVRDGCGDSRSHLGAVGGLRWRR